MDITRPLSFEAGLDQLSTQAQVDLTSQNPLGEDMAILCGTFCEKAFTRIPNLVLSHDCQKITILF